MAITIKKLRIQLNRLFNSKNIELAGRRIIDKKPHLVFLSRNMFKTDLRLSDKEVDKIYQRLESTVSTNENMFWVGPQGGPVKSGKLLSKEFKTIAVIPIKGKINPFKEINVIMNVIRKSTVNKLKIERGHLTTSAKEEGLRNRFDFAEFKGTFADTRPEAQEQLTEVSQDLRVSRGIFFENIGFDLSFSDVRKFATNFKANSDDFKEEYIVTVVPQSKTSNALLGSTEEAGIVKQIKDLTAESIGLVSSSPTAMMIVEDMVVDIILGKKIRTHRSKKKFTDIKRTKIKRGYKGFVPPAKSRVGQKFHFSIPALISAVNAKLHTTIKDNMGVPNDPAVRLRYQTGRFAKSAKVVGGISRNNAVQLFYKYQNNPYDTFAPGGRLHKPARNPKAIIGKSVREIAIELFANRVQVIASEAK